MDVVANDHIDQMIAQQATGSTTVGANALRNLKVDLYKTDIQPTRDKLLSDYTAHKCDYDGYGQDTITWNGPSRADDGFIEVVGTMPEFRPTGSVTPNTAYGFYTTMGDGSLGFAGRFDNAPLPMGDTLDAIVLTLRYRPAEGAQASVVS